MLFEFPGIAETNYHKLREKVKVKVAQSRPTLCDLMNYTEHGILPGQNAGVGSLSLLQEIFPTPGSSPSLPHCRQILYQLSHRGSPYNLVAYNKTLFSPNSLPIFSQFWRAKVQSQGADQGSHLESSRGGSLFACSSVLWHSLACGQTTPSLPVFTRPSLPCVRVLSPISLTGTLVLFTGSGIQFSSVQFSRSVVSDSLQPHESQHARPPCPSPTPGVYSDSVMSMNQGKLEVVLDVKIHFGGPGFNSLRFHSNGLSTPCHICIF